MNAPRIGLATSVVDGVLYAMGGWDGTKALATVEAYEPTTDTWTSRANMPTARVHLKTSVVEGKIYAIGGATTPGGPSLTIVEVYDPASNAWTTRAPLNQGRKAFCTSAVGGRVYAIGGVEEWGQPSTLLRAVEAYDPAADRWTPKADMPTARYGLFCSTLEGRIYAIGGHDEINAGLQTLQVYDPAADTWATAASMRVIRGYGCAAAVEGMVYAIAGAKGCGGMPCDDGCTIPGPFDWANAIEAYNPETNTWVEKAEIPTARFGLSCGVLDGKIFAVGGMDKNSWFQRPLGTVEAYDARYDFR